MIIYFTLFYFHDIGQGKIGNRPSSWLGDFSCPTSFLCQNSWDLWKTLFWGGKEMKASKSNTHQEDPFHTFQLNNCITWNKNIANILKVTSSLVTFVTLQHGGLTNQGILHQIFWNALQPSLNLTYNQFPWMTIFDKRDLPQNTEGKLMDRKLVLSIMLFKIVQRRRWKSSTNCKG